jgi:hypothetical protein
LRPRDIDELTWLDFLMYVGFTETMLDLKAKSGGL